MTSVKTADRMPWIRSFHPAAADSVQLVALPHAGGSASAFRTLSAALAPEIEVLAVQYPGRLDRYHEPVVTDIHVLADRVAEALESALDRPVALFGQSMGASVAFELALRLEQRGVRPRALVLLSRTAPGVGLGRPHVVHQLGDAELLAELEAFGAFDARIVEDEDLLEHTLTVVRGDYRAVESYRPTPGARVGCPVSVLVGDQDPRVSPDQASAWGDWAREGIDLRVFEGGHFFLEDNLDAVAELVRGAVSS